MKARKIAIACQGGGTHAAFTWGVLTKILETKRKWDTGAGDGEKFDITAISGTSAGALCALGTWYGLAPNTADPDCGTLEKAIERLNFLWTNFAARTPIEKSQNMVVGALLDLKEKGVPFPDSTPYNQYGELLLTGLSLLGARQQYLSFPALLNSLCPHFQHIDWPKLAQANMRILAGAIEIYSGNFEVFDSDKTLEEMGLRPAPKQNDQYNITRWRMRRTISLEGVAASGTLPEVLQAQQIKDKAFPTCTPGKNIRRDAYYWDGLYSQNPPVRQLLDLDSKEDKADEIWVIRINPQEVDSLQKLTSLEDIRDRENDLAGNLSLNQELDHILTMNKWLTQWGDNHPLLSNRKIVEVRTIKMKRDTAWGMRRTSKFDRDPQHLEKLHNEGREVAEQWLTGWRARGKDFDSYPNDARYSKGE
ncbi:MAG: patatin-like phospholipase family protein [Gammaproteobacteria bacterium]